MLDSQELWMKTQQFGVYSYLADSNNYQTESNILGFSHTLWTNETMDEDPAVLLSTESYKQSGLVVVGGGVSFIYFTT